MKVQSMNHLSLILALLLAAGFIFFGVQKFGTTNPVFSIIAERSGIGLFEPLVRMMTGAGELLAALMLLIPAARKLGTLLGLAILIGAIGFHLSPWLGINVPGIGHGLFATAVIMLVINVILARRLMQK